MNKFLVLSLLAVLAAPVGRAAPPTALSVDLLLAAAKTEKTLESMTASLDKQIRAGVEKAISGQALTAQDRRLLDALRAKMTTAIADQLSWPKVRALYAQVYADTFTQEEVDGLIAFYSSPVGQSYAEKQTELTQNIGVAMQGRVGPVVRELRAAVNDTLEQIEAAHSTDAAAPSPAAAAPATTPAN